MTDSGPKAWEEKIPLWTDAAIKAVEELLKGDSRVFEWGAGASTIWLAMRVGELHSVEHDPKWYKLVAAALAKEALGAKVCLHTLDDQGGYVEVINSYGKGYFDFIFIDGRRRVDCITTARPFLRSGGYLLLDDSQRSRYLPGIVLLKGWKRTDYSWKKRTTSIYQKP